jgi:hypothetical protein
MVTETRSEVVRYRCDICSKVYVEEQDAKHCELMHKISKDSKYQIESDVW